MSELKQCPYDWSCMCLMDHPCEGCETYGLAQLASAFDDKYKEEK